jgi:hypothetical protein
MGSRFAGKKLGHPDEIRATKISLGRQMNTDYRDTKYKEYQQKNNF